MKCEVEFDEDGLVARIARASRDILRRAGAYVRRVAQRKVVTSPKPSTPGQPPHSRKGLLKRAILFASDGDRSVLVGPGFNFVGESASAHELNAPKMSNANRRVAAQRATRVSARARSAKWPQGAAREVPQLSPQVGAYPDKFV